MGNTLTEKIKYWAQILMLPIYWFSFIVPRNKKIWLFGSTFGRRFADNPRYLYLYVNQYEKENIRAIWISHNKELVDFLNSNGYEAYYYKSLKGIWYSLRGSVYIFDNYSKDINFWTSGGAKKVNLWHGIPLKKIQADNIFDNIRHPKNSKEKFKYALRRMSDEKPSHYVLTTSDYMVPIFSSAFRTDNVLTSGYPRNDRLISKEIENLLTPIERENKEKIEDFLTGNKEEIKNEVEKDLRIKIAEEKISTKRKMVYYMPTFRDSENLFFDVLDLERFQKFLAANDILFCAKLHPKSKLKARFNEIKGDNILVIDADTDPYVFLEMADVLVTDYSSIYFDYLLTDKPIIFFNYDLEEYLRDSREMYFDYEEFTPGEKAANQQEFEKAILNGCAETKEYIKKYSILRKKVANKVFNETKMIASPRLTIDIKKILGIME